MLMNIYVQTNSEVTDQFGDPRSVKSDEAGGTISHPFCSRREDERTLMFSASKSATTSTDLVLDTTGSEALNQTHKVSPLKSQQYST